MIRAGSKVKWKWGHRYRNVKDVFDRRISTTIKGTKVTRNGEPENLAVLIHQENGNEVLKLESEIEKLD